MKLDKKDLKLIGAFIATNHPKVELNYALVGRDCIFATDVYKAIKFHSRGSIVCKDLLIHKKVLKGFEGTMSKDDIATITSSPSDATLTCGNTKLVLDGACFDHHYPDTERILEQDLPNHFKISDLNDILFELTQKYCFIEGSHLFPLMEYAGGDWYDVFYRPQGENDAGAVKIVTTKIIDEEEVILYTAVILGRKFESQAK